MLKKKVNNTLDKIRAFWSAINIKNLTLETLVQTGATTSTYLLAAAKAILTGNIIAASVAMKGFFIALGPVGWVISIIGILVGTLSLLRNKVSDVVKENAKLNEAREKGKKQYQAEADRINTLSDIVNDNTTAVVARRKAIEDLKDVIPGYNASISDEGILTKNNTSTIKSYLIQLEREMKLKAEMTALEDAHNERARLEKKIKKTKTELSSIPLTLETPFGVRKNPARVFTEVILAGEEAELNNVLALIAEINKEITKITEVPKKKGTGGDAVIDTDLGWGLNKDESFLKSRLALKNQYQKGEITSDQEYSEKLLALEIASLKKRLDLNIENGPETPCVTGEFDRQAPGAKKTRTAKAGRDR